HCGYLHSYNSSQITISGGSVGDNSVNGNLVSYDNSQITISGGSVGYDLHALDNSQITISGGSIGGKFYVGFDIDDNSILTVLGKDFAINGNSVDYGEYNTMGRDWFYGTLTGILASGDLINNDFEISRDSKLILAPIPEPATILLLGLGVLIWLAGSKVR
ncbi:unnamed protein product, partial [marine sediment metagenome]